ncbi:hypothetical protein PICSAR71_04343 [Mycobacterium avium subsp. paratuberculosis]|nr:hypothetical protein PICSAR71_04343 [Mycobacterium avium subsp. paratuberculosis]
MNSLVSELTRAHSTEGRKRGQGVHGAGERREHHVRLLRRRLRHGVADHNRSANRAPSRRQVGWQQRTSGQLRPPVHQGGHHRRPARRPGPDGLGARAGRPRRTARTDRHGSGDHPVRETVTGDHRRARPGRDRDVRVRPDVAGGAVPGEQADQGFHRHQPDRVELATVHGQRRFRLQAVARRRRTTGFLPGLRTRRRVLRHRRQHGRLPPDPVPAHDGPRQGGRETHRRRPAPHRDGRKGGPVPADRPGDGSRTAQRPVAPDRRKWAHRPRIHRRVHRGLGGDAQLPGAVHPRPGQRNHRHPRARHPRGGSADRRGRQLHELLDDGPQPEHARHLEHQRHLQPAPGHRGDLQAGQRPLLAHRSAQRDGRPRNGLHGTGFAGPAVGGIGRRPRVRRRRVGCSPRKAAHRGRHRNRRHVLPDGRRADQGMLDHLHQSRCLRC